MEPVVLKFTESTQFTDDELFEFCAANKDLRIERDQHQQIIVMAPTGATSGRYNFKISALLGQWTLANEQLGYGFDSSTGFRLPNGAMRAPDAAWVSKERWDSLSKQDQEGFAPLTPDFVVEVRSKSDSLKELQAKMLEWTANGCRLAWLIDPLEKKAYIYNAEELLQTLHAFDQPLSGGDVLPGFSLDLSLLR